MSPTSNTQLPLPQLSPYIPGLITPVVGVSGGVNQQLLVAHGSSGLVCILRPYDGQAEGDFVELFCASLLIPVDFYTVSAEDVRDQRPIALRISEARLPDGTAGPILFRVTHLDHRREESQRLTLKIDTVPPANREPITAPPWVNEQLPRPQPALTFIDSAAAGRGVAVRIGFYPVDATRPADTYRAVRDRIRVIIGGQIIEHRVTESEANGRNPVTITVYYATWLKIGSGMHACAYDVIDEVGNYTPGRSPTQMLEVRLDPNERLLDPASIVEAPSGTLDVDRLAGADATLRVAIAGKGWAAGDNIRVTIRGRTMAGVDIEQTYTAPVPALTNPFADIPWPNADVQLLIGALIQLSYERVRASQVDLPSENTFIQVTGTPAPVGLAPPQVPAANAGVLHPLTDPVLVRVPAYTGQNPFDAVTLVLEGTRANGHSYYAEQRMPAGEGDVIFDLPNGADGDIRQLDGGSLLLYYYINQVGERPPSASLRLNIGEPQDALPAPEIRQAPPPDFTFDPEVSLGNANVTVRHHPSFSLNATVTLHVEGSAMGGSAPPDPFTITAPWLGQDLPFVIARVYVLANLNRSMRVYYTVQRPGQRTLYSRAQLISVGSVLQLPVPQLLESTITGPNTARLNPLTVLPPSPARVVTLRVRYSPMLASDDIQPFFNGTYGLGTPSITPKPGDPMLGYVDFQVQDIVVGANLGLDALLSYTVTRAGATSAPSQVLVLSVEALPEQLLEVVSVPQAAGGNIDVTGAHNVVVRAWPFMRTGQPVWIDIKGSANLTLRDGARLTATEFSLQTIITALPGDYLRSLPNLSRLSVETRVSLNNSSHKDFAVPLRTVNYRIVNYTGIAAAIPVGEAPNAMVLSRDGNRLYVACTGGQRRIAVIDTLTNRVINTFNVPGTPLYMALHPTAARLYVSDNSPDASAQITLFNTLDFSVVATLNGFGSVHDLTLDSTGSRLYVSDERASQLVVIDTTTHQQIATLPVRNAIKVALSPNNSRAHVATAFDWTIVNLTNNTAIADIGTRSRPSAIAHSLRSSHVYLCGAEGGIVTVGNTQTQRIDKTLSGLQRPFDVAFNPRLDRAYVTESSGDLLSIIDTRNHTVIGRFAGFNKPRGVVVTPDGTYGYVANIGNDTVSLVVF